MNRQEIKQKYGGFCGYCGERLGEKFCIDHIEPIYRNCTDEELSRMGIQRGSNTEENLMPACHACNSYKKTMTLEVFRQELSKVLQRLQRDSANYRTAKRFGLIIEHQPSILFHFETYGE